MKEDFFLKLEWYNSMVHTVCSCSSGRKTLSFSTSSDSTVNSSTVVLLCRFTSPIKLYDN